jgi:tRNA threonylcarbamoyladenosine modification (KEOPS) complex  Pcc1 subunit
MFISRLIFNFDSSDEAYVVFKSINPEINNKIPKTDIKASYSSKTINLEIESKDINSLRAACNSFSRWINTAINVKKMV